MAIRGRKERETVNISISFFSLEPRGERQGAAPFCAACGLLDHAQRIAVERILQGGLQNWAWYRLEAASLTLFRCKPTPILRII